MTEYTPQEIKLATEIANTLSDRKSLTQHLKFVRKYKEAFLREQLADVMAVPDSKIIKSRGALYTSLVNRNGGS
jgi:hypothetical protein